MFEKLAFCVHRNFFRFLSSANFLSVNRLLICINRLYIQTMHHQTICLWKCGRKAFLFLHRYLWTYLLPQPRGASLKKCSRVRKPHTATVAKHVLVFFLNLCLCAAAAVTQVLQFNKRLRIFNIHPVKYFLSSGGSIEGWNRSCQVNRIGETRRQTEGEPWNCAEKLVHGLHQASLETLPTSLFVLSSIWSTSPPSSLILHPPQILPCLSHFFAPSSSLIQTPVLVNMSRFSLPNFQEEIQYMPVCSLSSAS